MAANKRKILANAQKYLQKGQLDKALKEYATLVELDPRDANSRLKLGDIQLRQGNRDEAIKAYHKVAQQFMKDGFDAKAVAIYKQVIKIDDKRWEIYEPLAELYQRLGLTSDALAALQTAADAYNREGQKREALEILRKMATLDPSNTTSRLKIADLLRQEGLGEEAATEYREVAAELKRQGASDELVTVYERMLELEADAEEALRELGQVLVDQRQFERAEPFARRLVEVNPDAAESHELLAAALSGAGREDAATEVYRTLAELYRNRGDEDKAREIMQRFVAADQLAIDGAPSLDLGAPAPEPAAVDPAAAAENLDLDVGGGATALAGEPEQLLAEASVYLRYGKRERAISTLEAILTGDPDHRGALERLGEVHAEGGDAERAVEAWTRAARVAEAAEDADGFGVLVDRIAGLDPAAARALRRETGDPDIEDDVDLPADASSPDLAVDVRAPAADDSLSDVDLDIDLGDEEPGDEAPAEAAEAAAAGGSDLELDVDTGAGAAASLDTDSGFGTDDLEIDVDIDVGGDAAAPEEESTDGATVVQGGPLLDEDLDIGEGGADEEAATSGSGSGTSSSATRQQVADDLDEADFYFNQGLCDEAEVIYRRILELAPNHPQAMLRLGEIAQRRGDDPDAGTAVGAAGGETTPLGIGEPEDEAFDEEVASAPDLAESTPAQAAEDAGEELDLDIDLDLDGESDGAATAAAEATEAAEEPRPGADVTLPEDEGAVDVGDSGLDLGAELEDTAPEGMADPNESTATQIDLSEPPAPVQGSEETFDLAAELSDVFEEDEAEAAAANSDEAFESVFREFKKGVKATLSESDFEAHYDLGIAYREMGLLEDAVGEFQIALGSPERRLSSLHMLGLCALDLERPRDAVGHLEQALALPQVPEDQQAVLRFDLGRAFVAVGERERARAAFEAVIAVDPDFQDVGERLEALEAEDDDTAGTQEPEVETFESFDDVIAEAEAIFEDDADGDEAGPGGDEAPAEPAVEPAAEEPDPRPKKRRRRISFL